MGAQTWSVGLNVYAGVYETQQGATGGAQVREASKYDQNERNLQKFSNNMKEKLQ